MTNFGFRTLDLALGRVRDFVREGLPGLPALRSKPAMMIEGMLDRAIPSPLAIADFQGLWPNAPVIQVPGAGHYLQEDAPEVVVPLLQAFLAMLDHSD
jgi:haloalkane dehalogenase